MQAIARELVKGNFTVQRIVAAGRPISEHSVVRAVSGSPMRYFKSSVRIPADSTYDCSPRGNGTTTVRISFSNVAFAFSTCASSGIGIVRMNERQNRSDQYIPSRRSPCTSWALTAERQSVSREFHPHVVFAQPRQLRADLDVTVLFKNRNRRGPHGHG